MYHFYALTQSFYSTTTIAQTSKTLGTASVSGTAGKARSFNYREVVEDYCG
jgi:hypothetical protein